MDKKQNFECPNCHAYIVNGLQWDEVNRVDLKIAQPSPDLERGMWVTTSTLTDFGILMITKESRFEGKIKYDCLDIKGNACWGFAEDLIKKDFTESDLELLNTDEVKYELKKVGKEYYVYSQNTNEKGGEKIGSMYDTIHDAIKPEFDERVAMNLLRKQTGE